MQSDHQFLVGVDPGPEKSGYIYVCISTLNPTVKNSIIIDNAHIDNDSLLDQIASDHLDRMIIEGIANYGKQQGNDTIRTGYMIGKLIDRWHTSGHSPGNLGIFLTPEVRAGLLGRAQGTNAKMVREKVVELWQPILPTYLLEKGHNHELMALSLLTHFIQNVYGKEFFKS